MSDAASRALDDAQLERGADIQIGSANRESDCFAVEKKDIQVCAREVEDCSALRQPHASCKRGQLDPRTRIKGNKGY